MAQVEVATSRSSLPTTTHAFDHATAGTTSDNPRDQGVTLRVVILALLLAVVFGYALPVIDYKLQNTFLGGTHLPPGAVGVLLILLLVINPLLRVAGIGAHGLHHLFVFFDGAGARFGKLHDSQPAGAVLFRDTGK